MPPVTNRNTREPKMRSKLRLLLLSSGSLAAQNVIDALGERRERCLLIGVNSLEKSAGNFRCDVVFRVPPASSGAAYIDSIATSYARSVRIS